MGYNYQLQKIVFIIFFCLVAPSLSAEKAKETEEVDSPKAPRSIPLFLPLTLYAGTSFGIEVFYGGALYPSGFFLELMGVGSGISIIDNYNTKDIPVRYGEDISVGWKMSAHIIRIGKAVPVNKKETVHLGISLSVGGTFIAKLATNKNRSFYWHILPIKLFIGVPRSKDIFEFGIEMPLLWGNSLFKTNEMPVYDGVPDIIFFFTWTSTVYSG